jgi:DNA modification methylase
MMEIDQIYEGDCKEILPSLPEDSIDAIVTDPPYELGFMGKKWDNKGIAYDKDMWAECLRVLKPGGHMLAFGGSRTYHRMACAIEDAGFEVRDMLEWVYGSGFPKSLDISKTLDKMAGAEREVIGKYSRPDGTDRNYNNWTQREETNKTCYGVEIREESEIRKVTTPFTDAAKQWAGFGTALKPAHEPICLARKPLDGCTIVENVIKWNTGGLNIDKCRISTNDNLNGGAYTDNRSPRAMNPNGVGDRHVSDCGKYEQPLGRFPANLILSWPESIPGEPNPGKDAVMRLFPETKSGGSGKTKTKSQGNVYGEYANRIGGQQDPSSGSAARFFQACPFTEEDIPPLVYQAKASRAERDGSTHPTMKPLAIMRYLCRLITPPGGLILDPFGGSGTTALAAIQEGFHYLLIEQSEEHCQIAKARIASIPARLDRWP